MKGIKRSQRWGENISKSYIYDKALKSRICKELSKSNIKKTNNSIFKVGNISEHVLHHIQMANSR